MKVTAPLLIAGLLVAAPAFANPAAMQLAQKSNCVACHTVDSKLVGPSFKDIGKRYAGDPTAEEKLIAKVKKGGAGVWGPVPMPPNVTVKDADVRALVQWVLSAK